MMLWSMRALIYEGVLPLWTSTHRTARGVELR
jgi:hypothetical protein